MGHQRQSGIYADGLRVRVLLVHQVRLRGEATLLAIYLLDEKRVFGSRGGEGVSTGRDDSRNAFAGDLTAGETGPGVRVFPSVAILHRPAQSQQSIETQASQPVRTMRRSTSAKAPLDTDPHPM